MLDLIIKNGQCYINGKLENKDIAVKDGKYQKLVKYQKKQKKFMMQKTKLFCQDV